MDSLYDKFLGIYIDLENPNSISLDCCVSTLLSPVRSFLSFHHLGCQGLYSCIQYRLRNSASGFMFPDGVGDSVFCSNSFAAPYSFC